MKKLLAIGFAVVYLLVSSGLLLEIHHCMGRIADSGFTFVANAPSENNSCGKCGMEKSNSGKHCCKDEYKLVKLTIDQKQSSLQYTVEAPQAILLSTDWPRFERSFISNDYGLANAAHGPPLNKASKQSLLCVFRI